MLFPTVSSASAPILRSKSLSSVRTRHTSPTKSESIDPEAARHHALTAASLAFERAGQHEGDSTMTRRNSISSSLAASQHVPARRQSIRFAGPTAVPQRQLTRPRHSSSAKSNRAISPTSMATWKSIPRYSQYGPTSGSNVPEEVAVFDDEEFGPLKDIASAPSSYRRIRKSKSMFDPRKHPAHHHNKTPSMRFNQGNKNGSLKLSKSIAILGGRRNRMHQQSEQDQEAAVQMAREIYFQQVEGQNRDGLYPSVSPPASRRRSGLFRRTARNSSDTNDNGAIYSPKHRPSLSKPGLSNKARSFSATIKKRFKRVFSRSSNPPEKIPVQHLEARRNHYGGSANGGYDDTPTSETRVFSNVTSGMPSIRVVSSSMEPRSRTGSIHSAQSEGGSSNGRSRVTSWTNSTAANTLATVHAAAAKRLSIIQEHGDPYQGNSPDSPHRTGNSPYSAFRGPMEGSATPSRSPDPVDSQRVYSALMKRLESNSPEANTVPNNSTIPSPNYNGNFLDGASIPPRSSSVDSRQTNATVRRGAGRTFLERAAEGRLTENIVTPDSSPSPALMVSKNRATDQNPPSPQKSMAETRLESGETLDTSRFPFGVPMIGRTYAEHDLARSQGSEAASGSIYSRSASGNTPQPTESDFTAHTTDKIHLANTSDHPAPDTTSTNRRGNLNAKTSVEWKSINGLSQNYSQNSRLLSPNPLGHRGHRREYTQIDEGDVDAGSSKASPSLRGVPQEYPPFRWSGIHNLSRQGSPLKELDVSGGKFLNLRPRQPRSPISPNAWEITNNGAENGPPRLTDVFRSPNEIRSATSSLFSRSGSKGSVRASPDPVDLLKTQQNRPSSHSPANAFGSRYSPERARRLAAYQRNRLSQQEDATSRSENVGFNHLQENQNSEKAHSPSKENVYDANGTGLVELRADDPEMVDAYLRSRRQTYVGVEGQRGAFL
ncbi:MAG: hypothetical protein M1816_006617 [Peltula sp. TS41687]|nr:MAG: hypothetical protein M1816_006617 [Peltula sp. TS41687]